MDFTPVGVDIAKMVFQVHHVDSQTGEVVNKSLRREAFLRYFSNRTPCLIGMESCSGAHHWARALTQLGHRVRLMQGRFVKAFNVGNKSDAAEARAIWLAVQQPGGSVAVKTEAQQSMLVLHRLRQQVVKMRTMQSNALRGFLSEFGEVMGKSRAALNKGVPEALARLAERLPQSVIEGFREMFAGLAKFDAQIADIEAKLKAWFKEDKACQAIAQIPGVGLLTATAAVATMGDAKAFTSARQFSAYVGLVPRHVGSGGKVRLLGISKRGDTYLRTLLIHGARCVQANARRPAAGVQQLARRRPPNVVTVALANKMARTIWAVLARERPYDRDYVRIQPA